VIRRWGEARRDRLLAVLTATFACSYVAAARGIEDSLLADAVGAGGVPQGVGWLMLVAAVALFAKSFRGHAVADGGDEARGPSWQATAMRTGGLVAILAAYGLLLPRLGYPLTISLLVLASGWLAGATLRAPLLLCAAVSGPLLWAMFDLALQVRMPVGSLWAA